MDYTQTIKPTIRPANATFFKMFEENKTAIYYVPNFQRSYAWDVNPHVTQFFTDLNDCYEIEQFEGVPYQHFLGQIILRHAVEKETENEQRYEVIDGQQRLITFMMMCITFYKRIKAIMKVNRSLYDKCDNILKSILSIIYYNGKPRLLLSKKDHHYWEDIIDNYMQSSETDITPENTISHKKIKEALEAIDNFLSSKCADKDDKQQLKFLEDLYNALKNRMHLITVTSEPTEYMFALFQTVNDRGRLLTNGELLRAKTLEALKNDAEKQQKAEQCWDEILSDDEKQTNYILEWCYISYVGKAPMKSPSLFHQYIINYFNEAQKRHVNDTEMDSLLHKIIMLKEDVIICRELKAGRWPFADDERAEWQKSRLKELICRLRHTKAIPVLLSAAVYCRKLDACEKKTGYDTFYRILDIVDRFYFLYIKICQLDENNFADSYNNAALEFRNGDSIDISAFAKKLWAKVKKGNCMEIFEDYLSKQIYAAKRTHVKETHLLYLLEVYYVDDVDTDFSRTSTLDDAINIVPEKLSIEHIYPKGIEDNAKDEELEPFKHHLGNLTLLGKRSNKDLDRKLFGDKKRTYNTSSFRITRSLSKYCTWDKTSYKERQHFLEELAKKVFDLSLC